MSTSTYIAPKFIGEIDENNKKQGRWKMISSITNQLELEIDFKNGISHGLIKFYDSHSHLLSDGEFTNCYFVDIGISEGERIIFCY